MKQTQKFVKTNQALESNKDTNNFLDKFVINWIISHKCS